MNLYLVEWGYWHETYGLDHENTTRYFELRTKEHVWADSQLDTEDWAKKQGYVRTSEDNENYHMAYRISHVFAAATLDNKPTPPGLDTFKIERGKRL